MHEYQVFDIFTESALMSTMQHPCQNS